MKKITAFIKVLFAFIFLFGISSCELEGMMAGLIVPSTQISGTGDQIIIPSVDSSIQTPEDKENYASTIVANYGELLSYYYNLESKYSYDAEIISRVKEMYERIQSLGEEVYNKGYISYYDYNHYQGLIDDYYAQLNDCIYNNNIKECYVHLLDINDNEYASIMVEYGKDFELSDFYYDNMIEHYWFDIHQGIKYAPKEIIIVYQDCWFKQAVVFGDDGYNDDVDAFNMSLEDIKWLEDGTLFTNLRVAVTYIYGNYAFVTDEYDNALVIYKPSSEMNVGETYRISGRKDTYLGDIEIRDSEVLKHEYYYPLDINVRYVDEGNVWDELRYENNYRLVNIESATVEKVLSSYMYINLGGMEVRVNCKYADISAIYSGSIVSLKGVIQYYNGELRLVTSEVYYSQQYGNVRIDYNGDGNVDNWEYVTFGTWLYSAASMFTDREFLHWEEVYYDDYGYETVNVISFDSYLSYNVYRNDVLLRAVYKETNNDTYFASLNSNSYDSINIYDQSSKNVELKDFTVAVDSSGKIIYASKTSTGYGGPADGFYHDGNYICEPGKICGIFSLDYRFAGWPNTTYIDGQLVNAWTLYDVVVPYGGYIITGSEEQMTPLLQEIDPQFYSSGIFFEMVNDGSYNDNIRITAEIYGTYGLIGVKKGSYSGSTGEMYFELGENSYDYKHVDGVVVSGDCDIVENGNILHLYNCEKVYSSSYDAQGNSCLKLGTASIVGKFSFDVSENVNYVIINVAAYKNYDCIIEINGVQYEITTFSNDGAYTEIKIDTTYVKTISFSTVNVDGKKTTRCMINSIVLSN